MLMRLYELPSLTLEGVPSISSSIAISLEQISFAFGYPDPCLDIGLSSEDLLWLSSPPSERWLELNLPTLP